MGSFINDAILLRTRVFRQYISCILPRHDMRKIQKAAYITSCFLEGWYKLFCDTRTFITVQGGCQKYLNCNIPHMTLIEMHYCHNLRVTSFMDHPFELKKNTWTGSQTLESIIFNMQKTLKVDSAVPALTKLIFQQNLAFGNFQIWFLYVLLR